MVLNGMLVGLFSGMVLVSLVVCGMMGGGGICSGISIDG